MGGGFHLATCRPSFASPRPEGHQLAKASHKTRRGHKSRITSEDRPGFLTYRSYREQNEIEVSRSVAGKLPALAAHRKRKLGARHMTLFSPARLRGAQMRRRATHFPALLLWVLASASSLKPMGRGLVHLAMISTASGWRIPSQESQRQALAGNVERARDRRRLADNCNGMWSVTRSHPQSLAQPNLDVRCPSCAPQRQRGFLWDSLVKLR